MYFFFFLRLEITTTSDQSRVRCISRENPTGEHGVKYVKKFHHQKAKRRTCGEAQRRRESVAGGIPLHGNAGHAAKRMTEKKNNYRFMSSQLPRAVNTSRAAASLLVSGSGTKFNDTIKKGRTHGRRGRVSGTKIHE